MSAASEPAKAEFEKLASDQQKAVVEAVNPSLLTSAANIGAVIKSPTARKRIYGTYAVFAIAVGAVAAGFLPLADELPPWLQAMQAVVAYLAIPIGGLAAANTNTGK